MNAALPSRDRMVLSVTGDEPAQRSGIDRDAASSGAGYILRTPWPFELVVSVGQLAEPKAGRLIDPRESRDIGHDVQDLLRHCRSPLAGIFRPT
jgi:hypothetical protein